MTSASETLSTLNFGRGVTEITLGAAKKNSESGGLVEVRPAGRRGRGWGQGPCRTQDLSRCPASLLAG